MTTDDARPRARIRSYGKGSQERMFLVLEVAIAQKKSVLVATLDCERMTKTLRERFPGIVLEQHENDCFVRIVRTQPDSLLSQLQRQRDRAQKGARKTPLSP